MPLLAFVFAVINPVLLVMLTVCVTVGVTDIREGCIVVRRLSDGLVMVVVSLLYLKPRDQVFRFSAFKNCRISVPLLVNLVTT